MRIWTRNLGADTSGTAMALCELERPSQAELTGTRVQVPPEGVCSAVNSMFSSYEDDPNYSLIMNLEVVKWVVTLPLTGPRLKEHELKKKSYGTQSFKLLELNMVLPAIASEIQKVFLGQVNVFFQCTGSQQFSRGSGEEIN